MAAGGRCLKEDSPLEFVPRKPQNIEEQSLSGREIELGLRRTICDCHKLPVWPLQAVGVVQHSSSTVVNTYTSTQV
ncbi:uncharacterized protein LOC121111575 isoform X2 [Gallus gallus]|uniref:uncharacterized protein LOC121111575 isoform X2 n=1 Tax=Gallus gallus TaxID=9031 RepID=UPI001AE28721|nr:uncharacterized protein LOC121111575 isoform X2 [Gallus gallus]